MVLVAEVVAVALAPPASPTGRDATAGPFRVFVQDETVYVSLTVSVTLWWHIRVNTSLATLHGAPTT